MASVKILLKEAQPKKDGTIPIIIRITSGRKSRYISTGYAVKSSQFREGVENWVVKHPDAALINAAIEKKRSAIVETVYKADIAGDSLDVKNIGKSNPGQSFFKLMMDQQTIYEKRSMVSAFDKLGLRIKNLKAAWGRDVKVQELSKTWVDKYITNRIENGASPNTIKKDLSAFSGILKQADHPGKDYFKAAQPTLKKVPVQKEKLSLEEIKTLEGLPLTNLEDVARDMFLFSYYTHGMRFQSVALLKRSSIKKNKIEYRMNKGQKLREIIIHPKLQAIIDKYKSANTPFLFPAMKEEIEDPWALDKSIDVVSTIIRTRLKRVAIIAGIEKNLTMHIARHTFAYLSKRRGVSMEVIKDALGHSDFATTEMYLESFKEDEVNDAVKGLYD